MTNAENFTYQVGGSLPADAPSYVERQCDREYYQLLKESKYCYVFNCRQMGKSSLRVRVTHKLQAEGIVCATIDPQKIGVEVTRDQWYASAIRSLVGDLNLKSRFDLRSWLKEREMLSPVQRFAEFIETVVLREIDAPIVIFVEEIDRLLSLNFEGSKGSMDDFFGLVRSLFEDRPTKPEYNRLTFSFLGVATPTDLIQSNKTSGFNIGYAVEMSGFTFEEALPLMQGLARKVANPRDYLAAAVSWTGGQPFLIQRLLGIIEKELDGVTLPENIADWVEGLVQERIVTNWESQDTPPHLATIRDRVLSVEEKLRGRMLGCYQQVLADGELEDDRSEERSKLRLTGLVVRRDGKLRSYNPIYASVFNNLWVERQLALLRDDDFYTSALRAWLDAEEGQKQAFLLRGQALEKAEAWAKGKNLSGQDDNFLAASREFDKQEAIAEVRIKATKQRTKLAISGSCVSLFFAALALWQLSVADNNAKLVVNKAVEGVEQLAQKNYQIEALIESIKTLDLMKSLGKIDNKDHIKKLYEIISNTQERNKLEGHTSEIWDFSIHPNAERIISGSFDGTIKLWSIDGKLLDSKSQKSKIWSIELSHNAKTIALVDDYNAISLWQIQSDKLLQVDSNIIKKLRLDKQIDEQSKQISDLAFNLNDEIIAFSSWDGSIRLWEKNSKMKRASCKEESIIYKISFHPQKNVIAYGCKEGVYIWEIDKSDTPQLVPNSKHKKPVVSVKFSNDGTKLASASNDGNIRLWDTIHNYQQVGSIQSLNFGYLTQFTFDPQSRFIASSYTDINVGIKIWSLEKILKSHPKSLDYPEEIKLVAHTKPVNNLVFNPTDQSMIISSSSDSTIRIWSLEKSSISQSNISAMILLRESCNLVNNYVNANINNPKYQNIKEICSK